jgi:hypothetical protein
MPILAFLFPGVLIGLGVARIFGMAASVVVCAVAYGVAYGLLLTGWHRLSSALTYGIPKWGITGCSLVRLIRHINNRSQCIAEAFRKLKLVAPESVLDIS